LIRGPDAPAARGATPREPRQPQGHCQHHRSPARWPVVHATQERPEPPPFNDGAKMYRMRSMVPAFKQAPALPSMPFEGSVPVRAAKARQTPQRGTRRQPARESGTLDSPTADRHQGQRCPRVGARNTCSICRGFGHLQQCSRSLLSTLGGGGNRTRVLQYLTRASPGAACSAFLSPGEHAS
jgi:hypothetical protein